MTSSVVTLDAIINQFGGQLQGDSIEVTNVATVQSARAGDIAFVDNPKYQKYIETTKASALIVLPGLAQATKLPVIISENPKLIFAQVVGLLRPRPLVKTGIHASASIDPSATIGDRVSIGPGCVVEHDVVIGDGVTLGAQTVIGPHCHIGTNCHIHARVTLYDNTTLGDGCEVHSGAVLGADGFGYAHDKGQWLKLPQVGRLKIGRHVEIGANTTIDRGALDDTEISDGVIIDNLVQIGHNVKIGQSTAISAGCLIGGSAVIGAYCMIGGGSIFNGHISIADGCVFIPGAQVANSTKKAEVLASALTARPRAQWAKNIARFHHLDSLAIKVNKMQRRINQLEQAVEESCS